jgi:hypothetical protein
MQVIQIHKKKKKKMLLIFSVKDVVLISKLFLEKHSSQMYEESSLNISENI